MATSILKFILGDRGLLNSRVRKTAEDHSPIKGRIEASRNHKKRTTYVRTHGFSVRTNRDKFQTVGELYCDEDYNKDGLHFNLSINQSEQEQNSGVRKTVEDHSPIKGRIEASRNYKKRTTYVRTHGFSVRTNRDKYQTVGELYCDEDYNNEDLHFNLFENQLEQEQSGPVLTKKLTPQNRIK